MKNFTIYFLVSQILIGSLSAQGRNEDPESRIKNLNERLAKKGLKWRADVTSISHLTLDEFKNLCGIIRTPEESARIHARQDSLNEESDKTKEKNSMAKTAAVNYWQTYMSPVETQSCGNCWAHAASGTIEALLNKYKNNSIKVDLDEMDITNNANCGNCNGAVWISCGFDYTKLYGTKEENGYQYAFYSIASWSIDTSPSRSEIKTALNTSPVASCMDVYEDFQDYPGGIYEWDGESDRVGSHAIVIVGYDDSEGYWICKNSWGSGWGENGYFRIAYGQCDIEADHTVTAVVNHEKYFAKKVPTLFSNLSTVLSYPLKTNERCYIIGTYTLSSNAVMPDNYSLEIPSGSSLILGSYNLTWGTNSYITGESRISPNNITKYVGLAKKGFYPSLQNAFDNTSIGDEIVIYSGYTLPANHIVPNGVTLTFPDYSAILINSYKIETSTGSINVSNNAVVTPHIQRTTSADVIKGLYPSISSAANAASSSDKVKVMNSLSLSGNETFKDGVSLVVASGKTLTMNGYKITTSSGSFTVASGSTISPYIRRTTSTDNIVGLYPTIQSAVNDGTSGQRIWLAATSYTENVSLINNVALLGQGQLNTTLNGNVTFSYISDAHVGKMLVNGNVLINGGSYNLVYDLYFRDLIDINYGSGHEIDNCRQYGQYYDGRLDVYQTSVYALDYENIYGYPTSGVAGGSATLELEGGSLLYKDYGLRAYSGLDADLNSVGFCGNTVDVYAYSGADVDIVLGSGTFSSCPPPTDGSGSISWNACTACGAGKAAYDPSTLASSDNDDSADALLFKEAKAEYKSIQKAIYEAWRNGEEKERKEYKSEYTQIAEKLRKLASNYPESRYVPYALHLLSFIGEELGESEDFIAWAEKELSKAKTLPIKTGLYQALAHASVAAGQFEKAADYSDALAETSDNPAEVESALYGKGVIYQYFLGDKEKATEAYNDALAANPQSQYAENIAIDLAREGRKVEEKPIEEVTESEGFSLENYPNPANPTTTIVYTLPEATEVSIQVFDVRGRLVQTLVSGTQETGRYTILWNGADENGIAASSGMYFCRLQAGEKTLTRKMLLVR